MSCLTRIPRLHVAQDDLKAERVRTLSTMQHLRQQQDKRFEEEALYKARIAELLNELSAVRCEYLNYDYHYCILIMRYGG